MALGCLRVQVTDGSGNVVPTANVEVRREVTGSPLAAVKLDREGATPGGNGATLTTDSSGYLEVFLAGGAYRVRAYKTIDGQPFEKVWRYVPVGTSSETDIGVGAGYIVTDTFTGNGVTTTFTLTTAPEGEGNVFANVGGVIQRADAYTLSGADLIFSAAPGNSVPIEVRVIPNQKASIAANWLGAYNAGTAYQPGDGVSYGGSSYVALQATTGNLPTNTTYWQVIAEKGESGSGEAAFTRVRVVATANVAISTALENGDTLDGVTLATNDLVLLAAQTAPSENGAYVVNASGAATRHTDFDTYNDLPGAYFSVMEGSVGADTLWRCTSNRGGTLGVTALVIEEATGGIGGSTGSADNALLRSDGTGGATVQPTGIIVDDGDSITGVVEIVATGAYRTTVTGNAVEATRETADVNGGNVVLRKGRPGPAAAQSGDTLGSVSAQGYDGTSYNGTNAGRFRFTAAENFTTGARGCYFSLDTTAPTTTTRAERLRVALGVFHPSATGGDKGNNTLNFGAVYDDNTLLTDYVFDKWLGHAAEYSPRVQAKYDDLDSSMFNVAEHVSYMREHRRLYGMPILDDCIDGIVKEHSLGSMIQLLWQSLELSQIHIAELHARLQAVEGAERSGEN